MGAAIPAFGNQQQTGHIGRQGNKPEAHHQSGNRFTTQYQSPYHLAQSAQGENDLKPTGKMGCTQLHPHTVPYGIQRHAVDGGISEHIQGVRNQTSGLRPPADSNFNDKHDAIDCQ